jgi:MFS family permease
MVGPLVGGWLADHADWRAIFWINVPLAVVAVLISLKFVPESRDDSAKGLDWPGAVLAVAGLGAVTWGLTAAPDLGMAHPLIVGSLVGDVLVLAGFLWAEAREKHPMMPLSCSARRCSAGSIC